MPFKISSMTAKFSLEAETISTLVRRSTATATFSLAAAAALPPAMAAPGL